MAWPCEIFRGLLFIQVLGWHFSFVESVSIAVLVIGKHRIYDATWSSHEKHLYTPLRNHNDTQTLDIFVCQKQGDYLPKHMPAPTASFYIQEDYGQQASMVVCFTELLNWISIHNQTLDTISEDNQTLDTISEGVENDIIDNYYLDNDIDKFPKQKKKSKPIVNNNIIPTMTSIVKFNRERDRPTSSNNAQIKREGKMIDLFMISRLKFFITKYDWIIKTRPDLVMGYDMPWPLPKPNHRLYGEVMAPIREGNFRFYQWKHDIVGNMLADHFRTISLESNGCAPNYKKYKSKQCLDITDQIAIIKSNVAGVYFGVWPKKLKEFVFHSNSSSQFNQTATVLLSTATLKNASHLYNASSLSSSPSLSSSSFSNSIQSIHWLPSSSSSRITDGSKEDIKPLEMRRILQMKYDLTDKKTSSSTNKRMNKNHPIRIGVDRKQAMDSTQQMVNDLESLKHQNHLVDTLDNTENIKNKELNDESVQNSIKNKQNRNNKNLSNHQKQSQNKNNNKLMKKNQKKNQNNNQNLKNNNELNFNNSFIHVGRNDNNIEQENNIEKEEEFEEEIYNQTRKIIEEDESCQFQTFEFKVPENVLNFRLRKANILLAPVEFPMYLAAGPNSFRKKALRCDTSTLNTSLIECLKDKTAISEFITKRDSVLKARELKIKCVF